jgi:hypothetical protein
LGSSSSSASTPASNGSSSKGLSLDPVSSVPASCVAVSSTGAVSCAAVSSTGAVSCAAVSSAGALKSKSPAGASPEGDLSLIFNLYLTSSKLLFRLFFLKVFRKLLIKLPFRL